MKIWNVVLMLVALADSGRVLAQATLADFTYFTNTYPNAIAQGGSLSPDYTFHVSLGFKSNGDGTTANFVRRNSDATICGVYVVLSKAGAPSKHMFIPVEGSPMVLWNQAKARYGQLMGTPFDAARNHGWNTFQMLGSLAKLL